MFYTDVALELLETIYLEVVAQSSSMKKCY